MNVKDIMAQLAERHPGTRVSSGSKRSSSIYEDVYNEHPSMKKQLSLKEL